LEKIVTSVTHGQKWMPKVDISSATVQAVALLFRRATVNLPSSSRNVNFTNGQTDRILVPYSNLSHPYGINKVIATFPSFLESFQFNDIDILREMIDFSSSMNFI
jgi:hypothetical protein